MRRNRKDYKNERERARGIEASAARFPTDEEEADVGIKKGRAKLLLGEVGSFGGGMGVLWLPRERERKNLYDNNVDFLLDTDQGKKGGEEEEEQERAVAFATLTGVACVRA